MTHLHRSLPLLTLLIAAAGHAAPPPPPLLPAGKWTVDYADTMCVLSRPYGDPKTPVLVGFKPAPMADGMRILVLTPSAKSGVTGGVAKIAVRDAKPADGNYISWRVPSKPMRITAIDMKRSDLDGLAQGGQLSIKAGKSVDLAVPIGGPAAAFKALDACVANLLKVWGMDEKAQAAIASYAAGVKPVISYFSHSDYPEAALESGAYGITGVRFVVHADGKHSDCTVIESSGHASLDTTTCRIVTSRAKFNPALDKAGKPMTSLSFLRVRWLIMD